MYRLLLSCLLALASLGARAEIIDIDNATLERLLKDGVPLVDIRTQPEWEETGIVAGSHLLSFFDENGRSDGPAWLEKLQPLATAKRPVILICRSGNRSRAASRFLDQQAAYRTVYNVKEGINGWVAGSGALQPAAPAIAACRADRTC